MILFLDTEWADELANELVSLALVSYCGRFEFYAERDPLPASPTEFVRSVVYPLLDRGESALGDARFTQSLHEFIGAAQQSARPEPVTIAFDHRNDLDLLGIALEAFSLPDTPPRPYFVTLDLGTLGIRFQEAVEACFAKDSHAQSHRHHALIDARINCAAWRSLQ